MKITPSNPGQAQVVLERTHLARSTRALQAALDGEEPAAPGLLAFYGAAGRYLVFTMYRLCFQDQQLARLIRERGDSGDAELQTRLDALDERLNGHRALTGRLFELVSALAMAGEAGLADFVAGARDYLARRTTTQGGQHHSLEKWRNELIVEADWEQIAALSDAEIAAEKTLYRAVEDTAPPGLLERD